MREYRKIISKQIADTFSVVKFVQLDKNMGVMYCTPNVWQIELNSDIVENISAFIEEDEAKRLTEALAPISEENKKRLNFRTDINGREYLCLAFKTVSSYREQPAVNLYLIDESRDDCVEMIQLSCEMQGQLTFKQVLNKLDIPIVFTNKSYISYANSAFSDMLGLKQSVVHSTKLSKLASKPYQAELEGIEKESDGSCKHFRAIFPTQMGTDVTADVVSVSYLDNRNATVNLFYDRTASDRIKRTAAIYARIISGISEGIVITDDKFNAIWFNKAFTKNTGYNNENYSALVDTICHWSGEGGTIEDIISEIENTGSWSKVVNLHRSNGSLFPASVHIVKMDECYAIKISDISKQSELEDMLVQNRKNDYLTGVYNEQFFMENLEKAFAKHKESEAPLHIMVFGVDSYEEICRSAGRETANAVLKIIALRAKTFAGSGAYLARVGETRFAFMFEAGDEEAVVQYAENFMSAMDWPLVYKKNDFFIKISAGISTYPDNAVNINELYFFACDNHRKARSDRRSAYALFSRKHGLSVISHRNSLEIDLIKALKENEFAVYFQPKVEIKTGKVIEAEALVRWESPTYGTVSPSYFIYLAEETELIIPLGYKIIELVCKYKRAWLDNGFKPIKVSINLTFGQILDENFLSTLKKLLDENRVDPKMLEFEISEATATVDYDRVKQVIMSMQEMGIGICLDNFGTGTASIPQLSEIPLERITIDRSMMTGVENDSNSRKIIERIINLARQLKVKVIAEGVETEKQLDILKELGCDYYQGYYFSKPVSAEEFKKFLTR